MTAYLLAAIDGTGSREWMRIDGGNSHVHGFYRAFRTTGNHKRFWHGPGTAGVEVHTIRQDVVQWILEVAGITTRPPDPGSVARLANPSLREIGSALLHRARYATPGSMPGRCGPCPEVKVCLVGHSRGGLVAIEVARALMRHRLRVHFLGLFDAVDRAVLTDGGVIENVVTTYHAVRDPAVGSRRLFGNTGMRTRNPAAELYWQETFFTSHGGVGGDVQVQPTKLYHDTSGVAANDLLLALARHRRRAVVALPGGVTPSRAVDAGRRDPAPSAYGNQRVESAASTAPAVVASPPLYSRTLLLASSGSTRTSASTR